MAQSKAATVDEWMDDLPPAVRPTFEQLRTTFREELAGWEERMQWGMPGFGPAGGDNVASFNAQKRHIAFYAGPTAVERFGDQLAGIDCGKGCVRYRSAAQVDLDVVRAMLRDIRARDEAMC